MVKKYTLVWKGTTFEDYKIDKNGTIYSYFKDKEGIRAPSATIRLQGVSMNIAKLMSSMFLDGIEVGHKDGDKTNNSLKNLVPIEELPKKVSIFGVAKKVYHKDFSTGEITEYENAKKASEITETSIRTIRNWAQHSNNGWYYEGEEEPEAPTETKRTDIAVVLKRYYSPDKLKFIKEYQSARKAAEDEEKVTISRTKILRVIENCSPFVMNGKTYVFERKDNQDILYTDIVKNE
jgi:hypothetical protein